MIWALTPFGRASRKEFALTVCAWLALAIALTVLQGLLLPSRLFRIFDWSSAVGANLILLFAFVRRLHDMGKSGWLLLLYLVRFAGIVFWIWCFARKGDPGPNRFGPAKVTAASAP